MVSNGFSRKTDVLGIQLAPNKADIRPVGPETEITMTRSTLSDITAPDMQGTSLEVRDRETKRQRYREKEGKERHTDCETKKQRDRGPERQLPDANSSSSRNQ